MLLLLVVTIMIGLFFPDKVTNKAKIYKELVVFDRHSMGKNGRSLIAKKWHPLHMLAYKEKLPLLPTFRIQV